MKIIGTGSAVPSKSVSNEMLTGFLNTSDEWISTRTGIRTRRILTNEKLEDLAVEATRAALESAKISPDDVDFFICSNVSNNYVTPSLSAIVQEAVGSHAPCIDLNGACAGFVYSLDFADAYLQTDKVACGGFDALDGVLQVVEGAATAGTGDILRLGKFDAGCLENGVGKGCRLFAGEQRAA